MNLRETVTQAPLVVIFALFVLAPLVSIAGFAVVVITVLVIVFVEVVTLMLLFRPLFFPMFETLAIAKPFRVSGFSRREFATLVSLVLRKGGQRLRIEAPGRRNSGARDWGWVR